VAPTLDIHQQAADPKESINYFTNKLYFKVTPRREKLYDTFYLKIWLPSGNPIFFISPVYYYSIIDVYVS
jgi:hypothetical protein